jgi:hypothetical protein
MLGKLIEKVRTIVAFHRLSRLPAVRIGLAAIHRNWTEHREVTRDLFSDEAIRRQAVKMMEEVIRIATSPDPKMANREKLTNLVIELPSSKS